jgi:hypothetical protein
MTPRNCEQKCQRALRRANRATARTVRCVLLALALVVSVTSIVAGESINPRFVFVEENDALASSRDYGYTQGLRASLAFDADTPVNTGAHSLFDRFGNFLFPAAGAARRQVEWVMIGQSIFTPANKNLAPSDPFDRPYAAWLYTGVAFAQETAKTQLDSFEILAGIVGPSALGRQVQNSFHAMQRGSMQARGWNDQLRDEPGLLLAWDKRWKFATVFDNDFGIDFIPSAGVTLGNVFTYASAGGMIRFGRSLSSTWGPTRVRPSYSGASFFTPTDTGDFGFAFFAGVEGRAIARNIFLDGNTFVDSRSVDSHTFVADFTAGAELFSNAGTRLAVSVTKRTEEFRDQPGNGDLFGAVEVNLRF